MNLLSCLKLCPIGAAYGDSPSSDGSGSDSGTTIRPSELEFAKLRACVSLLTEYADFVWKGRLRKANPAILSQHEGLMRVSGDSKIKSEISRKLEKCESFEEARTALTKMWNESGFQAEGPLMTSLAAWLKTRLAKLDICLVPYVDATEMVVMKEGDKSIFEDQVDNANMRLAYIVKAHMERENYDSAEIMEAMLFVEEYLLFLNYVIKTPEFLLDGPCLLSMVIPSLCLSRRLDVQEKMGFAADIKGRLTTGQTFLLVAMNMGDRLYEDFDQNKDLYASYFDGNLNSGFDRSEMSEASDTLSQYDSESSMCDDHLDFGLLEVREPGMEVYSEVEQNAARISSTRTDFTQSEVVEVIRNIPERPPRPSMKEIDLRTAVPERLERPTGPDNETKADNKLEPKEFEFERKQKLNMTSEEMKNLLDQLQQAESA